MAWITRLQSINPFDVYGNNGIRICIVHLSADPISLTKRVCTILRTENRDFIILWFSTRLSTKCIVKHLTSNKQITMLLIWVSCFMRRLVRFHSNYYTYSNDFHSHCYRIHFQSAREWYKARKSVQNNLCYDNDVELLMLLLIDAEEKYRIQCHQQCAAHYNHHISMLEMSLFHNSRSMMMHSEWGKDSESGGKEEEMAYKLTHFAVSFTFIFRLMYFSWIYSYRMIYVIILRWCYSVICM